VTPLIPFDNGYARLPARFFAPSVPAPVTQPELIVLNADLARDLGIDPERLARDVAVLAGNRVPQGAEPIALAYAGHQFGGFSPRLGDGRAVLLGQVRDQAGTSWDIQLKGSGVTPFSRGGDGRAWMGPVLREYVLSEAMHALGVPTTRALAAVSTGQPVYRRQVLPGAVLTRVARSHVRVGTFEYFAARGDEEGLNTLLAHVLQRYLPDLPASDTPTLALLAEVGRRQAALVAHWMSIGFIHGVMNTDNSSVVGDTIDYGPCAFLDEYSANKVFSSIDHQGRYAYGNQPHMGQWNLAALARATLPLIQDKPGQLEAAQAIIDSFPSAFNDQSIRRMRAKLGLAVAKPEDAELVADLLQRMDDNHADFTNTFRALSALSGQPGDADDAVRAQFDHPAGFDSWASKWRARLAQEGSEDAPRQMQMRQVNPAYIPRNHQVEAMIQAAVRGDYAPLHTLLEVLKRPFDDREQWAAYAQPPQSHEIVHQTFCGT